MSLQSMVKFSEDAAGLERSLRLLQGFCTIATGIQQPAEDIRAWLKLRAQLALGRRYFRLLKWHSCWSHAVAAFDTTRDSRTRNNPRPANSIVMLLEFAKWSFLGMYFFLEMFTITNALEVTNFAWAPRLQHEANKCWVYALVLSMVRSLFDFFCSFSTPSSSSSRQEQGQKKASTDASAPNEEETKVSDKGSDSSENPGSGFDRWDLLTQLVVDGADLFIPGSAVGWIAAGPVVVGMASTVSTSITGAQIWRRVQGRV